MVKQRKLSDLTDQDATTVLNLLKRFQLELDGGDEDNQEVVQALQTVVRKFSELKVSRTPQHAMLTTKRVLIACSILRCHCIDPHSSEYQSSSVRVEQRWEDSSAATRWQDNAKCVVPRRNHEADRIHPKTHRVRGQSGPPFIGMLTF